MSKIVLAPFSMHKNLLAVLRKNNPFCDVKIMSKEEFLGDYYGRVKQSALLDLVYEEHSEFSFIRNISRYLPFVNKDSDDKKLSKLFNIKERMLKKHQIVKNEFIETFLKDKSIDIYGYADIDKNLKAIFERFDIPHTFHLMNEIRGNQIVYSFSFIDEEVLFVLNRIARLIKQGKDINQIKILCTNASYYLPISHYCHSFGFNVNVPSDENFNALPIVNEFLHCFEITHSLEEALSALQKYEKSEYYDEVINQINQFRDDRFVWNEQFDVYSSLFRSKKIKKPHFDNSVEIINDVSYLQDNVIFVLGFTQGSFPKAYKDNEYLSNTHLVELGLPTSIDRTEESLLVQKWFFSLNNTYTFTYSKVVDNVSQMPSSFVKDYSFEVIEGDIEKEIYSDVLAKHYLINAIEAKQYYGINSPNMGLSEITNVRYKDYVNSYVPTNVFDNERQMNFSYSKIKQYYECPFAYLLSRVYKLDDFEDTFASKLGTLAHAVFERQNDENFDFENVYQEALNKQTWNDEESILLGNIKKQIESASNAARERFKHMLSAKVYHEEKVDDFVLWHNTKLEGIIDEGIVIDDKYIILVDYKTNDESFDKDLIEFGQSLQLPFYSLLMQQSSVFSKYKLVGLYINNVIDKTLTQKPLGNDELIPKYLKLNGYTTSDLDIARKIDDTFDSSSSFIHLLQLTKDGTPHKNARIASDEEFKRFSVSALEKIKEAVKRIRSNDFVINPRFTNEHSHACEYCDYKDICFIKDEQRRIIKKVKEENG